MSDDTIVWIDVPKNLSIIRASAGRPLYGIIDTSPVDRKIPTAQEALAAEGVEYLFIDTPGKNNPGLDHALRAIGQTLTAVDGAGRPYVFVMNRTVLSRLLDDAIRAMAAKGRVATINLASRVVYPETAADGTAAPEAGDTKAAAGIVFVGLCRGEGSMRKAPRDLSAMIQRQTSYTAPELDTPAPAAPKKPGPKPKPPRMDARKLSLELDGETYLALRMRAGRERKTIKTSSKKGSKHIYANKQIRKRVDVHLHG